MVGGEFFTLGGEPAGGGDDEGGLWLPGGVGLVGSAAETLPPSSPPQAASRTQAPTTSESLAPDTHIPILMTPIYAVPRQFSRPAVRGFRGRSAGIQHEPVRHALWRHGGLVLAAPLSLANAQRPVVLRLRLAADLPFSALAQLGAGLAAHGGIY